MFRENVKFAIAILFIAAGAILFNFVVERVKTKHVANEVVSRQDEQFNNIMRTLNAIEENLRKINESNSKK